MYVTFIIRMNNRYFPPLYDDQLFHKASYSNHCLHHLLPVAKSINYALRDVAIVGHELLIDHVTSELHKQTFINRMLFSNCY